MHRWTKWTAALAVSLTAGAALAADHTDGPAVQSGQNPSADLNDVYSFMTADNDNLAMIMTIGGVSGGDLTSGYQYAFHVGRGGDALAALTAPAADWTDVICTLDVVTDVSCWVVDTADGTVLDYVRGDASSSVTSDSGHLRIHAGPHADPFYFHLAGFNAAQEFVATNFSALTIDGNGCPTNLESIALCNNTETAGSVLRGLLNGTFSDASCTATTPGNPFASINVNAIVVELDKSKIAGSGEYFQVWASTHSAN